MTLAAAIAAWSWDTGVRNRLAARAARPFASGGRMLDVGGGDRGIGAFLDGYVVELDLVRPDRRSGRPFVQASATRLPFRAGAFDAAVSVDVLEHLAPEDRASAVSEAARVSTRGVVLAFPHGPSSRRLDEWFRDRLVTAGRPLPDWLTEHLAQPENPDLLKICTALASAGASIDLFYSEPIPVARVVRYLAARSRRAYLAVNTLLGVALGWVPRWPGGYRALVVGRLGALTAPDRPTS